MNFITINKRVLQKVFPIVLGYITLGAACGMLGEKSGFAPIDMFGMSLLVYAGSGQFIGIAMMAQGASYLSLTLTIFIINLRHLLFSSSFIGHLKNSTNKFLLVFAHGITDETFAVNLFSFENELSPKWTEKEALAINMIGCVTWSLSNAFGCFASAFLNIPTALVSYLLIAMFIGIWSNYLNSRPMIITGVLSGFLAIIFSQYVPYKLHIVLATILTSALACYVKIKYQQGDFIK